MTLNLCRSIIVLNVCFCFGSNKHALMNEANVLFQISTFSIILQTSNSVEKHKPTKENNVMSCLRYTDKITLIPASFFSPVNKISDLFSNCVSLSRKIIKGPYLLALFGSQMASLNEIFSYVAHFCFVCLKQKVFLTCLFSCSQAQIHCYTNSISCHDTIWDKLIKQF